MSLSATSTHLTSLFFLNAEINDNSSRNTSNNYLSFIPPFLVLSKLFASFILQKFWYLPVLQRIAQNQIILAMLHKVILANRKVKKKQTNKKNFLLFNKSKRGYLPTCDITNSQLTAHESQRFLHDLNRRIMFIHCS